MHGPFGGLPEYGAIIDVLTPGRSIVAWGRKDVPQVFGREHRWNVSAREAGLHIDASNEEARLIVAAINRMPRPTGGGLSDMTGEAVLTMDGDLWTYGYATNRYDYRIEWRMAEGCALTVTMDAPATLTDLARETATEGYSRRTAGLGRGMLPRPDAMRGGVVPDPDGRRMTYSFDPSGIRWRHEKD